ncbi:MAG: serine hydrolase, partial [Sphingobacteriia bacterium]
TSQSTQLPSSRRGLGWDKPDKRPGYISPASDYATASAYGHLGFTGTCVWVDPEADLIYILLANRTYPDSENNTFLYENVRGKVADLLYESIRNARTP